MLPSLFANADTQNAATHRAPQRRADGCNSVAKILQDLLNRPLLIGGQR
jgi:hypothetical protein